MTDTALDIFVENIVSGLSDGEMCLFIEKIAKRMRREARIRASREKRIRLSPITSRKRSSTQRATRSPRR